MLKINKLSQRFENIIVKYTKRQSYLIIFNYLYNLLLIGYGIVKKKCCLHGTHNDKNGNI